MYKNLKILIAVLILLLSTCYLLLNTAPVKALTMTDGVYILQMGNLNTAGGTPTGGNYRLDFTLGQTAPGLYIGTNYKIRSGFKYVHTIVAFSFSIDSILVDFGVITPTFPVTRTNILTVTSGSAHGYGVTASENHQLQTQSGAAIPDTICDSGPCSPTLAAPWTSNLSYGFGYRCDNVAGSDCVSDFAPTTYYKSFAQNPPATAQTVMQNAGSARNHQSQITYKVNISGSQAPGVYQNVITYIATPTF